MKTNSHTAPDETWLPPAGRWLATLHEMKIDTDQVRLIFRMTRQEGLTQDYMAGKTFKRERYKFLLNDLIAWLGSKRVQALCEHGTLPFENLKELLGEAAMIEIELLDRGQDQKFRNIKSIKSCHQKVNVPAGGIDLSSLGLKWN